MARKRLVSPGLFANERLAACSPHARLLFVGLWCLADREGRLEDRPIRIHAELFPYEEGLNIPSLLDELERGGFVRRYSALGRRVLLVVKFLRHQNPHRAEVPSILPPPPASADQPGPIPGPGRGQIFSRADPDPDPDPEETAALSRARAREPTLIVLDDPLVLEPAAVPVSAVPPAQGGPGAALGKAPRAVEGEPAAVPVSAVPPAPEAPGAVPAAVEFIRPPEEPTRTTPARATAPLSSQFWPRVEQFRLLVSQGLAVVGRNGCGLAPLESAAQRDDMERQLGLVGVERAAAACIEKAREAGRGSGIRSLSYFAGPVADLAMPVCQRPHGSTGPPRSPRRAMAPVSDWSDPEAMETPWTTTGSTR